MKRIILDTNFLLIPIEFKVDIFTEIERIADFKYQLCIIDKTLDELNLIIKRQKGISKKAAKIAIQLVKKKNINLIKTDENKDVDSLIIALAKPTDLVATQDRELRQKLMKNGIRLITLRQKKYLVAN